MAYSYEQSWHDFCGAPTPPPQQNYHRHTYRRSGHLSPEPQYSNLHRSHSQGPLPTSIHIHNKIPINQETTNVQRSDPTFPMPAPMPPPPQFQQVPVMAPPSMFVHHHSMVDPYAFHVSRLGEQLLADEFAEMRLHRHRSHSRGRLTEDRLRWDLEQHRRDLAAAAARRRHDEEIVALKTKLELEAEREAAKRKKQEEDATADRKRVIAEHERQLAADAKAAADAEAALKLKLELQAREEKERERKAYDDFVRKQKEKEEAKEREYRAFLCEQKEKQEAEDRAKKEEQARIDSVMKRRLEKLGWSQHDIEIALDPEKAEEESKKKKKQKRPSGSPVCDGEVTMVPPSLPDAPPAISIGCGGHHMPVYPRINRKYLDFETLEHYCIPWEWDRTNGDFIILLCELDKCQTNILFEHTRRRREGGSGPLLIDKVKDSVPRYAWVRRKSRERSKSRGRDIRVTEIVRR